MNFISTNQKETFVKSEIRKAPRFSIYHPVHKAGLISVISLILLTLVSPFTLATELQPAECVDLMSRLKTLIEKNPSFKADFVEERMSHLLNKPLTTEGSIAFSIPNKFRREVKGNNPSTTITKISAVR